jgi:hypothetical protein
MPLVRSEAELFAASRVPEPARPANLLLGFLAAGVFFAGLFVYCARLTAQGRRAGRIGMAVLGATWSLLAAVIGTVMLLSWTSTDHVFMYRNENLLQLSPLSFVLVPLLITVGLAGRRIGLTARVAAVIAGLSSIGLALQAIPGLDQVNGQVIALALPMHLAIAWGTWLLASSRTPNAAIA